MLKVTERLSQQPGGQLGVAGEPVQESEEKQVHRAGPVARRKIGFRDRGRERPHLLEYSGRPELGRDERPEQGLPGEREIDRHEDFRGGEQFLCRVVGRSDGEERLPGQAQRERRLAFIGQPTARFRQHGACLVGAGGGEGGFRRG
jgi:hypothetical protein